MTSPASVPGHKGALILSQNFLELRTYWRGMAVYLQGGRAFRKDQDLPLHCTVEMWIVEY